MSIGGRIFAWVYRRIIPDDAFGWEPVEREPLDFWDSAIIEAPPAASNCLPPRSWNLPQTGQP